MEDTYLFTPEEQEEASLIREEMLVVLSGEPSVATLSKVSALESAYDTKNLDMLRLYRRFLADFRPFCINQAARAKTHLGYPAESVDAACIELATRFNDALVRNRPASVRSVDSQTMGILLRHVVANPDDLEMVLRIILERRARGYKDVLKMLHDLKTQGVGIAMQDGIL